MECKSKNISKAFHEDFSEVSFTVGGGRNTSNDSMKLCAMSYAINQPKFRFTVSICKISSDMRNDAVIEK